jgi:hypothetical protein
MFGILLSSSAALLLLAATACQGRAPVAQLTPDPQLNGFLRRNGLPHPILLLKMALGDIQGGRTWKGSNPYGCTGSHVSRSAAL